MVHQQVSCPHCGDGTRVDIPAEETVEGAYDYYNDWDDDVSGDEFARCQRCDGKIVIFYE